MTPFGPQLIGETEKTLNALLRRALVGTGLTEPHWVSLVIASTEPDGVLSEAIGSRARFDDAAALVTDLERMDLVAQSAITPKGIALVGEVRARITALAGGVWQDLPADDVAAATRVLNTVRDRANDLLAAGR